jgi:hypothetical protein
MPNWTPSKAINSAKSQVAAFGGVAGALAVARTVAGAMLAILGFMLVMDRLSLRGLLAETGPEPAWRLAMALRAGISHPDAQIAEFAAALVGVVFVVLSIRTLRTLRRRTS